MPIGDGAGQGRSDPSGRVSGPDGLTVVHGHAYYPRVNELSDADPRLSVLATEVVGMFHTVPQRVPPSLVRELTLGQMGLLFLLHRQGPLTMGRIAELFELSSTASSGFVARVERHGLVARQHRSSDRRIVECQLTDTGRGLVDEITGVRLDVIRRTLSLLEPRELAAFQELIGTIRERQHRLERPA